MCYDLSFSSNIEKISDYLPILKRSGQLDLHFDSTYHKIAQAHPTWPVITNEDGDIKLKLFQWGVIAGYMDTPEKIKKSRKWMVNARSEKILDDKRSYWNRIRKNRCLIAATGFFEHREVPGLKRKVPYYIRKKDQEIFFVAGLYGYSPHPDPETGEIPGTFTLITRPANAMMMQIHNSGDNAGRMPLILSEDLCELWLQPNLTDEDIRAVLTYEISPAALEAWPVNPVRKPKPDDESVIEEIFDENIPAI